MSSELNMELRRDRLYEQIADRILEMIIDDRVSPGDRLPSERELAQRLGVSRPVIREAIRTLGVRGVVSVRPGSGTYIRQLTTRDASSPIDLLLRLRREQDSFDDLHEVRLALEIEIASLAAERATPEHVAALVEAIDGMATAGEEADAFIEHDMAFHDALARATQNQLFLLLLAPITDLLHDFRLVAYHHDPNESLEGGLRHHRRILACVQAHDIAGARAAMGEHLEQARAIFVSHRDRAKGTTGRRSPGKTDTRDGRGSPARGKRSPNG